MWAARVTDALLAAGMLSSCCVCGAAPDACGCTGSKWCHAANAGCACGITSTQDAACCNAGGCPTQEAHCFDPVALACPSIDNSARYAVDVCPTCHTATRESCVTSGGCACAPGYGGLTCTALLPTGSPSSDPSESPSTNYPTESPSTSYPSERPSTSYPSERPSTSYPSERPSTGYPTDAPYYNPVFPPSKHPTVVPSPAPIAPTTPPSVSPSRGPSRNPSTAPSAAPVLPTVSPSISPTISPTTSPSAAPTARPTTAAPSVSPTAPPIAQPTVRPSAPPSVPPTVPPSASPTVPPSFVPTAEPTLSPSDAPTRRPSGHPTGTPSEEPTRRPTTAPSQSPMPPTQAPTWVPTAPPSFPPSDGPSMAPSAGPSTAPSAGPSTVPSAGPSTTPSARPTTAPTTAPSARPSTAPPSAKPSPWPTMAPTSGPTSTPSASQPSAAPTSAPVIRPSAPPTDPPNRRPSTAPTSVPSSPPSREPSGPPVAPPSGNPSVSPSLRTIDPSPSPTQNPVSPPAPTRAPGPPTPALPTVSPRTAPGPLLTQPPTAPPVLPTTPSGAPSADPTATSYVIGTPSVAPLPPTAAPSGVPQKASSAPTGIYDRLPKSPLLDIARTGVAVEAVPAMLSGVSAVPAITLLIEEDCGHDAHHYGGYNEDELSVVLHPLQFHIAGDVYVGCVVGNLCIAMMFFYIHVATRRCLRPLLKRNGHDPVLIEARLAQPAVYYVVMIFLHQGSTYATGHLLARSPEDSRAPRILAGVVGFVCFVVGMPALTWFTVLRHLHRKTVWEVDDADRVKNWFLGPGEWCSQAHRWHERYAMCVWQYRPPNMSKAVVVQYTETSALSMIAAVKKYSYLQCAWAQAGYAVVLLLHGAWVMCSTPYAKTRDSVWEAVTTALTVTAMTARIVAYGGLVRSPSVHYFDAASALLLVTVASLAIKLFLDFVCWVYVTSWGPIGSWKHEGRRDILQARVELRAACTFEPDGALPDAEAAEPSPREALLARRPGCSGDVAQTHYSPPDTPGSLNPTVRCSPDSNDVPLLQELTPANASVSVPTSSAHTSRRLLRRRSLNPHARESRRGSPLSGSLDAQVRGAGPPMRSNPLEGASRVSTPDGPASSSPAAGRGRRRSIQLMPAVPRRPSVSGRSAASQCAHSSGDD
eukprot:TRINITY_DN2843_c0_g1_i1.p1 TRINITY_DN2843_c0_g1~~TRINITY_DN2843_c0_g1_i1.p1  ORF type:complete len:1150 (+),score=15.92 TRINITY_DN2843_c0_g1_i1:69-3518(+)